MVPATSNQVLTVLSLSGNDISVLALTAALDTNRTPQGLGLNDGGVTPPAQRT